MNREQELIERLNPTVPVEPVTADEIQRKCTDIESIMKELGLTGKIIRAVPSPNVVRFEIEAETDQGGNIPPSYQLLCKKIDKKISFKQRVKRNGSRLFLEIPNDRREFVPARHLFGSEQWQNTTMMLPVMLGVGDYYAPVMFDLAEATHCLIAGGVGGGKHCCAQMLLTSLMLKHSPEEV
jgi:S-DNA-T family DNA segregation ATPase FtsK/SpoIIIE